MNIGYDVNLCSKLFKNKLNKELEDYNITAVQLSVLMAIENHSADPELNTAVNLARKLDMDKPTMSAIVNRLIEKDYIEKQVHPLDGRMWILSLTSKFKDNYDEFNYRIKKVQFLASEDLTQGEIIFFNNTLNKIIHNLK
ncbi:MarR family transcriptional regulator [uncultured Clostridium sp.]|uniref:MarR family winged helix-turn-helix transcriptional regulator n=1 Tax=uncultured Clostridium sp. TaxID=59620 RepID=UPI0025D2A898|nr:MarR family transcriptional regulator [uncultured Clostridium sp.]